MASFDSPIRANIKVHDIYYDERPSRDGSMNKRLMVVYGPNGVNAHLVQITACVDDLRPEAGTIDMPSRADDANSAVGTMARVRWAALEPRINAFIAGQTMATSGTALGEWPGIDVRRANLMRTFGITTLEELITAPESSIIGLSPRLPDIRQYIDRASKFLEAKSTSAVAVQLEERDEKIALQDNIISDMGAQMAEMRAMLDKLLGSQIDAVEEPKRRGRPPRAAEPAETEAAA